MALRSSSGDAISQASSCLLARESFFLGAPFEEGRFVKSPKKITYALLGIVIMTACGGHEKEKSGANGYVASRKVWNKRQIEVCWENGSPVDDRARWVRQAVQGTWQAHSGVRFVGWGPCRLGQLGIKIGWSDIRPRTLGLGNELDGVGYGMVLNSTYEAWDPACKSNIENCIKATAVHEFGHALGFAHEHHRPDRPATCIDEPAGSNGDIIVGEFDPQSIMNYCNHSWNVGGGMLSQGDIATVQRYYGTP